LGATAEHAFGAAKGFDEVVYLYGGTSGIGGGVIVRGELLRGAAGYAGELGHAVLSDSSREDYSGFHGTLEAALERSDDVAATQASADALENQCRLLGAAISSFANIFNPQVILLGGFLGSIFAKAEEMVTGFALERILGAPAENLKIMRAELGSTQIIKGAAGLPISALLKAPKSGETWLSVFDTAAAAHL
jgi:predicted NBD/HSP70 family sugar kinase